jgi:hypothetical protein
MLDGQVSLAVSSAGSSAQDPAVSSQPSTPPSVLAMRTRMQQGISIPKKYTDGTIRYGMFIFTCEPSKLSEALEDDRWHTAMQDEYTALMKNKTWHLVPPNSIKNLIECKWIYRIKKHADGTIDRYKALIRPKRISFPEHFCYCFFSNLCVLNATNTD